MAVYTEKDVVDCSAPEDLYESLIVTPTDKDFGPSKKTKDPQIVVKWEIAGVKNESGGIDRELKRGDKVYIIAGLSAGTTYFTITPKAMRFYKDFWKLANPGKEFSVDDENPDLSYLDKLYMSAVVRCETIEQTKPLTDEQKEILEQQGLPIKGETVVDDEGKPIKMKFLKITNWNRRFMGDVPVF